MELSNNKQSAYDTRKAEYYSLPEEEREKILKDLDDTKIGENGFVGDTYMKHVRRAENPFIVDGKVIGLPFNLSDVVQQFGKDFIPDELGIYHLFYNDQLVYIGMSKRIRGRLLCHLKDNDMVFNNCLWWVASLCDKEHTIQTILEVEYKMIKKFKPVLNSMHTNCR